MPARRSERLGKALGEFVVIVVGVLVALWIDAGWSWMQDRRDEDALLRDLRADFAANVELVEHVAARRRATAVIGARLLREGVEVFPADSLDIVSQAAFASWTLNPRMGALESALSAGRIDLLRNDELRSALAAWSGYLTDAEEETLAMSDHTMDLYVATMPAVLRGSDPREVLQQVLDDPFLTGILATRAAAFEFTAQELDSLVSETQRVLDLLDSELNGAP